MLIIVRHTYLNVDEVSHKQMLVFEIKIGRHVYVVQNRHFVKCILGEYIIYVFLLYDFGF